MSFLSGRRWPAAVAALLFVVVTGLRLSLDNVADGYSLLYVLPIALVALRFGLAGGLAAAGLATALFAAWTQLDEVSLGVAGYLTRALAFFTLGGLVGFEIEQRRRAETEKNRLFERVEAMARTDDLTGLLNRRAWGEELRREVERARRGGHSFAVALLDIDRFKEFNDRHGHPRGDDLLRQVGHSWRTSVRVVDTVARYGGEEFAVLLPDCPPGNAFEVVDRLRCVTPMGQTVSAGVAIWDGNEGIEMLLKRADVALYQAKHHGRDRVIIANADSGASSG